MLSPNAIVFTFSNSLCYEVSLCDNCQRQSCKAFIGLTNRAKMIGGGDPFYLKFWIKLTELFAKNVLVCCCKPKIILKKTLFHSKITPDDLNFT